MNRGPTALFAAIVAVGLGPALWLGAQLGDLNVAPLKTPSTVSRELPAVDLNVGGAGAGAGGGSEPILRTARPTPATPTTTRRVWRHSSRTVSPSPSATPSSARVDASASVSASPSVSASADASTDPGPSAGVAPSASGTARPEPSSSTAR